MSVSLVACARALAAATRLDFSGVPGGADEVIAAIGWSIVTEPGDGVAGALREAVGMQESWRLITQATSAHDLVERVDVLTGTGDDATRAQLAAAWSRWSSRLDDARYEQVLASASSLSLSLLTSSCDGWPAGLDDLGVHAPALLWVRGDAGALVALSESGVALVGARAATAYGEHCATELAGAACDAGMTVVSGGAYGIDGMSHRAALASGKPTVAVLAGGLDRLYPAGHEQLLLRIAASGAVVSEAPPATNPTKWRFLQRNRILAASTNATVVVEAGRRSGSLNTAHHALALGRELGAVPGPITSSASVGCHLLLREATVRCVASGADLRELMGWHDELEDRDVEGFGDRRSEESTRVLDALNLRDERDIADIARLSGLEPQTVMATVAPLELAELIVRSGNGWRLSRTALRSRSRREARADWKHADD